MSIVARDGEQIELLAIACRTASFAGQAVDVGRADELAAVATDGLPAMIVGHDDNNVRYAPPLRWKPPRWLAPCFLRCERRKGPTAGPRPR